MVSMFFCSEIDIHMVKVFHACCEGNFARKCLKAREVKVQSCKELVVDVLEQRIRLEKLNKDKNL